MAGLQGIGADSALGDALSVTAGLLRRSTVHVRSSHHGAGAGVIWQPDGLIVTNAHVAPGPAATVEFWDGCTFDGQVVARDPRRDLAAVRIGEGNLPSAPIADSDTLRVGQLVAAVGNPLGLSGALSLGIIHAIAPSSGHGGQAWIQADVRLLPGNSGGPLADVEGRVIGINSMVAGGLGLAVPSNAVEAFLGGRQGPRLGVALQPVVIPHGQSRLFGLLVLEVVDGSPADQGGLMVGDIVAGVEGRLFGAPTDLRAILAPLDSPTVRLELLRGGVRTSLEVQLASEPERDAGAAA